VSVKYAIDLVGNTVRRNVDEVKAKSATFQDTRERPVKYTVAISPNDMERWAGEAKFIQDVFLAYVPQMPDFVGRPQFLPGNSSEPVVCV
jgi:hypothetical protein